MSENASSYSFQSWGGTSDGLGQAPKICRITVTDPPAVDFLRGVRKLKPEVRTEVLQFLEVMLSRELEPVIRCAAVRARERRR